MLFRSRSFFVPSNASVRIDHQLATGQPRVGSRPSQDETPRRVDVYPGVSGKREISDDRKNHSFQQHGTQLFRSNFLGMLCGDDHALDAERFVPTVVSHGDLRLPIRTKPIEPPGPSEFRQAPCMTMFVVTHEMGFAREVADRVIFIDVGQIQEENTPAEFFRNPRNPRLRDFLGKIVGH